MKVNRILAAVLIPLLLLTGCQTPPEDSPLPPDAPEETGAAAADYLRFLSGGCSTDPVSLLKLAGVDMSTPQPVQDALDLFGRLTEELEDLLA